MVSIPKIKRYCDEIAAAFRPDRIILFGSYAYGKPTNDSDVDVLVVMPKSRQLGPRASLQIREKITADFSVDILVRDPTFIAERLREGVTFLQQITEKGRVMYEGSHS